MELFISTCPLGLQKYACQLPFSCLSYFPSGIGKNNSISCFLQTYNRLVHNFVHRWRCSNVKKNPTEYDRRSYWLVQNFVHRWRCSKCKINTKEYDRRFYWLVQNFVHRWRCSKFKINTKECDRRCYWLVQNFVHRWRCSKCKINPKEYDRKCFDTEKKREK